MKGSKRPSEVVTLGTKPPSSVVPATGRSGSNASAARGGTKARLFDSSVVSTPQEAVDFITNILESSTEYSVIGKDLTGRILLWNEGARRLYGYEPEEVVGKSNSSILHVPEDVKTLMQGFRYDAHPMGILVSSLGGLSTFYPEAKAVADPACRYEQVVRLIAKMPTLAAFAYRHAMGLPYAYPDAELS